MIEISYVGTSNKTTFAYDALNHRIVQNETVGATTTTTRNLWCGEQVCQTRTGADVVTRRHYTEGEQNVTTGQKLVYLQDQLGSVRDVTDATTGALVAAYDYSPYGTITRTWGSASTDYRYAGLFYHPASGLMLATYRAFDPVTSRWLNRDPIRERGGINLYGYVDSDPINWIDPDGLKETIVIPVPFPMPPSLVPGTPDYYEWQRWAQHLANNAEQNLQNWWGEVNSWWDNVCQAASSDDEEDKEHTKNKRPSTKEKHQKGEKRKKRDKRGGEKGDQYRPY